MVFVTFNGQLILNVPNIHFSRAEMKSSWYIIHRLRYSTTCAKKCSETLLHGRNFQTNCPSTIYRYTSSFCKTVTEFTREMAIFLLISRSKSFHFWLFWYSHWIIQRSVIESTNENVNTAFKKDGPLLFRSLWWPRCLLTFSTINICKKDNYLRVTLIKTDTIQQSNDNEQSSPISFPYKTVNINYIVCRISCQWES